MSAPRPHETYPFHPPALFTSYAEFNFYLNIKINANECYLYVILVLVLITAVIAVCFLLFVQSIVIICMARKLNKLRERYVLTPYCSCVERSRKWTLLIAFFFGGGGGGQGERNPVLFRRTSLSTTRTKRVLLSSPKGFDALETRKYAQRSSNGKHACTSAEQLSKVSFVAVIVSSLYKNHWTGRGEGREILTSWPFGP